MARLATRRMATFDDMTIEGWLTVYDKGVDESSQGYGEFVTRTGDIFSPRIPNAEPLRLACEHFVHRIRTGETPRSDGVSGLRVVRVLEQRQWSLEHDVVAGAGDGRR
jgi:predicted dehydrogenase